MRGCESRQAWRAVLGQDRDRPYLAALDEPDRSRIDGAELIDPPRYQILHRWRATSIGNMRDVDPDCRIEQRTREMGRAARTGRTVLHPALVDLGVGNELFEIAGG